MKFTEWIKKRVSGRLREPDYRELQEIVKKAGRLAGVYNHGELAKLIRQYSHSERVIEQVALMIAKSEPFDSPGATGNRYSIDMMDALNVTGFMKKHAASLSDIAPEDSGPVHGMLAMHTFMRDAYQKAFPNITRETLPPKEVDAAIRILDHQRKNRDVLELCELASYGMMPSTYVKMRYGIEDKCRTYEWLEGYMMDRGDCDMEYDVRMNATRIAAEMHTAAEKAVEGIPGIRLPDFYLEELDHELEKLGRIAMSPECMEDLTIGCDSVFLARYGIDRNASREEQSAQAKEAYRELDGRLVRATGRRPYAGEFQNSLKKDNRQDRGHGRQEHRRHIRNPPPARSNGIKPSF